MLTALIDFVHRLRDATIPVSMVETLDAVESLRHIDPRSRAHFRATLGATLVKRAEHLAAFEALFDVYFAPRRDDRGPAGRAATSPSPTDPSDVGTDAGTSAELLDALLDALRRNDEDA